MRPSIQSVARTGAIADWQVSGASLCDADTRLVHSRSASAQVTGNDVEAVERDRGIRQSHNFLAAGVARVDLQHPLQHLDVRRAGIQADRMEDEPVQLGERTVPSAAEQQRKLLVAVAQSPLEDS